MGLCSECLAAAPTSTNLVEQAVQGLQRRVSPPVCVGQSKTEGVSDAACTEPLLTLQAEDIFGLVRGCS